MKRINNYLLMVLFLFPFALLAQEPYGELDKIMALYQSEQHITFNINYEFYEDLEVTEATDSLQLEMVRSGGDFYVKATEYEMLNHGSTGLVVNHEEKIIVLQKDLPEPVFQFEQLQKVAAENGLQLDFFQPSQDNAKGLRFAAPEYSETQIDFIYDEATYQLKEVMMKVKVEGEQYSSEFNNTRIRAIFSGYQVKKNAFPHSLKQFMTKNASGKPQAVGRYRSYRIIES